MNFDALKDKTIGIIIPDFDYGGEEKRALFFANNYVEYFKEVFLFAPRGAQTPSIDPRVKHIPLPIRGIRSIFTILQFVKKHKIDFIQGHKRNTFPYLYALEKFSEAKVNFNFDNIYLDKEWLYRIAPTRLYYLSDYMKDFYAKFFPGRENMTINMGGEFYNKASIQELALLQDSMHLNGKFVLLSLGRLSDQKNQELMLRSLSLVNDNSIVCLLVGEGPKEMILKKLVDDLKLQKKVQFLGHRKDVDKLLSLSHVLVQSSVFEGFPNVFIEAASLSKPIITTRVGSYSTLVRENGIAVDVNDEVAFASAIKTMKMNYEHYAEKAEDLRKSDFFQQFHKSNMLQNYLLHYHMQAVK